MCPCGRSTCRHAARVARRAREACNLDIVSDIAMRRCLPRLTKASYRWTESIKRSFSSFRCTYAAVKPVVVLVSNRQVSAAAQAGRACRSASIGVVRVTTVSRCVRCVRPAICSSQWPVSGRGAVSMACRRSARCLRCSNANVDRDPVPGTVRRPPAAAARSLSAQPDDYRRKHRLVFQALSPTAGSSRSR